MEKFENKAELSEKDLEEVVSVLEDTAESNPKTKVMRDIIEGEVDNSVENDGYDYLNMENPDTKGVDLYKASMDKLESGDERVKDVADKLSEKWNIPAQEMVTLFKVAERYRSGEKFSLYGAMPENVKKIINEQIIATGNVPDNQTKSLFCGIFLEEFIDEFINSELDQELVDFNKSIQETLGTVTNIADMYSGHIRYMMEVDLKKKAEGTDDPVAKDIYLGCSNAFTDSWTYRRMLELLDNNSKVRRKLYKDNFQFARFCSELDYRNKDSKFSIRNVKQLYDNLLEHLGTELNIAPNDAAAFTILFIKSTYDMDMKNIKDAMYVYYTIFNIVNLGFDSNKSKFWHAIVNNIKKVFNRIWECTGDTRRFEIAEDIDWVDDLPTEEDMKAFESTLSEVTE